jgi:hypothetical protein
MRDNQPAGPPALAEGTAAAGRAQPTYCRGASPAWGQAPWLGAALGRCWYGDHPPERRRGRPQPWSRAAEAGPPRRGAAVRRGRRNCAWVLRPPGQRAERAQQRASGSKLRRADSTGNTIEGAGRLTRAGALQNPTFSASWRLGPHFPRGPRNRAWSAIPHSHALGCRPRSGGSQEAVDRVGVCHRECCALRRPVPAIDLVSPGIETAATFWQSMAHAAALVRQRRERGWSPGPAGTWQRPPLGMMAGGRRSRAAPPMSTGPPANLAPVGSGRDSLFGRLAAHAFGQDRPGVRLRRRRAVQAQHPRSRGASVGAVVVGGGACRTWRRRG